MSAKLMSAILAASLAMGLLTLAVAPRESVAGQIRKMYLTENKPGMVTLAFGKTTVLPFFSKPARVVPGSPEKIQIDFVGKDLAITPLAPNPGNLIVYTTSGRYVILFKIGSASSYDDVVEIEPGRFHQAVRTLRLLEDSFRAETIELQFKPRRGSTLGGRSKSMVVSVSTDAKRVESEDLQDFLANLGRVHCDGCRVTSAQGVAHLLCTQPIRTLNCASPQGRLVIKRIIP